MAVTPEEEDERAERYVCRLLTGMIEAHNWQDVRSQVSILRALQRASLTLVASHPLRTVTRAAADAGVLRLMQVLTEWVSQQPLAADQQPTDAPAG
jgi:hypothetical protein